MISINYHKITIFKLILQPYMIMAASSELSFSKFKIKANIVACNNKRDFHDPII